MTLQGPKLEEMTEGVLLVDKEQGDTSFGAVRRVRSLLGIKKAGHAGTLDPFATGLLVVLLGQGTKLSACLMAGGKRYQATLRLGIETDTLDLTGRVVRTRPVPAIDLEEVLEKTRRFLGEGEQVPPSFSAVKHEGRRAYELARRGIQVALKKRKVTIHRLDVLSLDLPEVTVLVECSGGTYIRSLAADLGEALGAGAHVKALRRLGSGSFTVDQSVRLGELGRETAGAMLRGRVISLRDALPEMREHAVDEEEARRIRSGCQPGLHVAEHDGRRGGLFKMVKGPELVAVAAVYEKPGGDKGLRVLRVFH